MDQTLRATASTLVVIHTALAAQAALLVSSDRDLLEAPSLAD